MSHTFSVIFRPTKVLADKSCKRSKSNSLGEAEWIMYYYRHAGTVVVRALYKVSLLLELNKTLQLLLYFHTFMYTFILFRTNLHQALCRGGRSRASSLEPRGSFVAAPCSWHWLATWSSGFVLWPHPRGGETERRCLRGSISFFLS